MWNVNLRNFFSNLTLKTQLLFMMVSLCFLSITFLFILYSSAERDLREEVRRHTEELSTAIQVSIEEISKGDGDYIEQIKDFTKLKKKGIKEISVLTNTRDIIASSNPSLIGKKLFLRGEMVKNTPSLTEFATTTEGQKRYEILLPVIIGREHLGYIHIATQFDDFTSISRANHRKRLMATLAIFSIGILVSIYLSRKYTEPIQNIADAARRVANGDLSVKLDLKGNDEIGMLTKNFNEMVRKLNDNRELEAKLKEAEHMSKIGGLASGIAHEVRNPLNLINLSIDHLRIAHAPKDEVSRKSFLETIGNVKSEIERLDGMVSNFLNFGKPLNLNPRPIQVAPLLQEVFHLVGERCQEQKITVEMRDKSPMLTVRADYRHIKTCLLNIFLNAIQAMPEGGRLAVETSISGGMAAITVEDTGCGIDPENIPKIFEPYFTTKDLGIGLGLALTKRIIDEHGGRIVVNSVAGSGTAVIVSMPFDSGNTREA